MTNEEKVIKLEKKKLEFEFNIAQGQFNKSGTYLLKLSIQNSHRHDLLPQVLLNVNDSKNALVSHSVTTDKVFWNPSRQSVVFKKNNFKFRFPKGFCKNDNNYDVYLLIEASLQHPLSKKLEHVGEARLAIYPRTEAPKANLHVKRGENFYRYSSILTLLRPLSKATLSMHCGRLSYSVSFREYVSDDVLVQSDESDDDVQHGIDTNSLPFNREVDEPATPQVSSSAIRTGQPSVSQFYSSQTSRDSFTPPNVVVEPSNPNGDVLLKRRTASKRAEDYADQPSLPKELGVDNTEYVDGRETSVFDLKITSGSSRRSTFSSCKSFHLDLLDTPLLAEPPTYREKTMDRPNQNPRPNPVSPMTGFSGRGSPTITSPRSVNFSKPRAHVALPGHQDVLVMVHGATSLPSASDGSDPVPFVTLKSRFEEEGNRTAQSSTHASLNPTHSPRWGEVLTMKVADDEAEKEELILTVADAVSKEKLVTYRFSLDYLVPFHTYHLELIQPTAAIPSGVRLFVSIIRRISHLPRLDDFGFCALEVTVRDFQYELSDPSGPLIAVARIVPDYSRYRSEMLSLNPLPAGVTSSPITFPNPNPTSFVVARKSPQGHPQVTLPSKQESQPEWNEALLFTDAATMFTPYSALVIELYSAATLMTSVTWNIRNPAGFCTVLLNDDVFRALTSDEGRMGVRMDDVLIQKSQFVTKTGVFPSLRLTMRLIATERPDMLVSAADCDLLPPFDFLSSEKKSFSPSSTDFNAVGEEVLLREDTPDGGPPLQRTRTRVLVKEDELPPSDAIKDLLPDYVMTDSDVTTGAVSKERNIMKQPANQKLKIENNREKSLLDHQARELEKYREAVKRMSADLLTLRRSLAQVQEENALLRRELLLNKEVGQDLMDDLQRGVVSSREVADKFVAVKHKLTKESEDLKKYKGKVQNLQNQMIKANEREKGYLMQGASHRDIENTVLRLQDKLKKKEKLEETCIQQEKVIQKMEKLLSKYMKSSNQQKLRKETEKLEDEKNVVTMLSEENAKLQIEVDRLKAQQMHAGAEKTDLIERLRRAEHRNSSLEAQLDHNARAWAKEKHDLTIRLQEHRNGILRTTDSSRAVDSLL